MRNDREFDALERKTRWVTEVSVAFCWLSMGLFCGSLALWMVSSCAKELSGSSVDLLMTVRREASATALSSRCGECTQPGDTVYVTTTAAAARRGIRVYRDETLVAACDGCSSLSVVLPLVGSYQIVGFEAPRSCAVNGASYDSNTASLQTCGAKLRAERLDVR